MNEQEMLEFAAKAFGANVWTDIDGNYYSQRYGIAEISWNPLTDDGDALRLAVELGISLNGFEISICNGRYIAGINCSEPEFTEFDGDPFASTRRAIVRAAAAIGESMP